MLSRGARQPSSGADSAWVLERPAGDLSACALFLASLRCQWASSDCGVGSRHGTSIVGRVVLAEEADSEHVQGEECTLDASGPRRDTGRLQQLRVCQFFNFVEGHTGDKRSQDRCRRLADGTAATGEGDCRNAALGYADVDPNLVGADRSGI